MGLRIHENVTGEVVSAALESIFKQTGDPIAILKDKGSDKRQRSVFVERE